MGRTRQIDRESIVATARTIANQDGLEALTMQRVAKNLEVTTMALYRHVPSKAVLVDDLVALVYEDILLPPADAPWRERVLGIGDAIRTVGRLNPGLAELLAHRPYPSGANVDLELMLRDSLVEGGVPPREVGRTAHVVLTTFLGSAARVPARRRDGPEVLDAEFALTREMVGLLLDEQVRRGRAGRRGTPRSPQSPRSSRSPRSPRSRPGG
jgi:AcrR family transcriptional regulator